MRFQKDQSFSKTLQHRIDEYFKDTGKSKYGGSRLIWKALFFGALYIAPLVLLLTINFPWYVLLIFAIVIGVAKAGLGFNVMHDSIHGTFSKSRRTNNLISITSYFIGAAVVPWKIKHNMLHHTYTNVYGMDGDIDSKAILRLSYSAPLWKIHRFQYIYAFFFYTFGSLAFVIGDFASLISYNKEGFIKRIGTSLSKELVKLAVYRILYLGIFIALPVIFLDIPWWGSVIGFFTMHFVCGIILSVVFQMAHVIEDTEQLSPNKEGVLEHSWAQHQLETTANFAAKNWLIGWYTGGLNYQVEHHLFPNISHVHYKQLSLIVKETALEYKYPYYEKKTFREAMGSHIQTLKNLGRTKIATTSN